MNARSKPFRSALGVAIALGLVTIGAAGDEPRKPEARERRGAKKDTRAVVSFVGFEQGKGGSSRLTVDVERPVEVTKTGEKNRLIFRLAQARIPFRNNLNPLVTAHFDTVVASARLERAGDDVALVVELRESAAGTHKMTDSAGASQLVIDFPPRSVRPSERE